MDTNERGRLALGSSGLAVGLIAMHVAQVTCVPDRLRRPPDELLDAWPTLGSIAQSVRAAGAEVTVVLSSHHDAICERDGVTYRFVAERWTGGSALSAYVPARLAHTVRSLQPHVVHVNGFGFPFHTRALSMQPAPVLVQHHADNRDGRMRALKRWGLANIAAAAFTSREQAQPFTGNRYIKASVPVFEIPESSTRFQPGDRAAARQRTSVYGSPAVLWVGHLNENKDPLTVLDGLARALQKIPEAHLWCCYRDAPLLGRIAARLASDERLAGHVHLLGAVEHATVEQLCRAADFFMLGSHEESCGFAVLEALACGATPIVSDIPAFRAITGRGQLGALCEPGNPDAFAAALASFSRQRPEYLRTRAIAHFQEELSFAVVGRKLTAAYEATIAARAAASNASP